MDVKLLTKRAVDLPKIVLILGLIFLAYNLSLNIPIISALLDTPFLKMAYRHLAPLLVLPLFVLNAIKQNSTSSKVAAILYTVYTFLAVLTPSLQDIQPSLQDIQSSLQSIHSEDGGIYRWLYENGLFEFTTITLSIVNVIASSLQIIAIGFFADSHRKSSITFRVAVAFVLSLFATTAFSKWDFIPYTIGEYQHIKGLVIFDAINRFHICVVPIVIFAIRNRKNRPLCISSFASIPILLALTITGIICNAYAYCDYYTAYCNIPKLLLYILLFGISVAMSILFFVKKDCKIDFLDIFILLAITSSMFDSRYSTMFWTVGLFAAIAADYLKTKFPTNKHIDIAMISIFLAMILSELIAVIGFYLGALNTDFNLIQSIMYSLYGSGFALIMIVPFIGLWIGSTYVISSIALIRLFKLLKSER